MGCGSSSEMPLEGNMTVVCGDTPLDTSKANIVFVIGEGATSQTVVQFIQDRFKFDLITFSEIEAALDPASPDEFIAKGVQVSVCMQD